MEPNQNPVTIDEYISRFPDKIQNKLNQLRETIKNSAPGAEEKISYGMPTFHLKKNLVHFAVHTNHIGFYPGASGVIEFVKESRSYKNSKGSIQFPIDEPLPLETIIKIVKFRVLENTNLIKPK